MRVWVNFKELRQKLQFEEVLRYFEIEVKRKGNQHQGFCPLPGHEGKKHSPSFSANLEKGIFQCFGCGAKGNVLEFAVLMKGSDPKDGDALRSVAVELQRHFFVAKSKSEKKTVPPPSPSASTSTPIVINHPLDFELKDLDAGHPYLLERGFTRDIVRHFGVGMCSRGLLKDRLAIPLHAQDGGLLGYAGRVLDDSLINEENPRYRFPSRRERSGTIYEFKKSLFLYNGFRVKSPADDLIVVEGFTSVWWLTQHGFPWTVALMGSDCSEEQAELITNLVKPSGRVWVMPDGDKAGERLAQSLVPRLSTSRFVRWVKLGEGRQPTDVPAPTLKENFKV